jgi:RNA polymerase sigma-70 factor (ECF subfamily)
MSLPSARRVAKPARSLVRPGMPAEDAIPLLMRDYGGMVHAVARRVLGTVAEADDIAQDTFLSAYRNWSRFRGEADPGTWLYRIAIRAAGRQLRRRSRRRERAWSTAEIMPFADPRLPDVPDDIQSPVAKRLRAEAREQVNDAIATLPATFRVPVVLKDIAELSLEDIAKILGTKVATVKTRIHRGRLMLRAALLVDRKRVSVPPAVYERSMCLDLLKAKMDALDQRVPFRAQTDLICERCRNVFASLDLGFDACKHAADEDDLPPAIRRLVLAEVAAERAAKGKRRRTPAR